MVDSVVRTAERLLHLRRCADNEKKSFESQLYKMSKIYDITIDLDNDKVKADEKNYI